MSELFKWLRKTEDQQRGLGAVGAAGLEFEPEQIAIPVAPMQVAPRRASLPNARTFNLELADPKLRAVLDPRTMPGEQFRFLHAKLAQLRRQNEMRSMLVTSTFPGEGKTFVSCCLAGILAQEQGRRVLLLEADLRKPKASQVLGIDCEERPIGFAQILQGKVSLEDALLSSSNPGMDLFFLPAGEEPENPSELLASDNLHHIIRKMKELFDWIVVDSAPVLTLSDPARLAPLCDGILMVVQANKTPAKLVQKAVQLIGKELVRGIILNRVQNLQFSRYYHNYYSGKAGARK